MTQEPGWHFVPGGPSVLVTEKGEALTPEALRTGPQSSLRPRDWGREQRHGIKRQSASTAPTFITSAGRGPVRLPSDRLDLGWGITKAEYLEVCG